MTMWECSMCGKRFKTRKECLHHIDHHIDNHDKKCKKTGRYKPLQAFAWRRNEPTYELKDNLVNDKEYCTYPLGSQECPIDHPRICQIKGRTACKFYRGEDESIAGEPKTSRD